MKAITTDFQVLTYCKTFFSNLYTKAKTNKTIQEELLKPIQPKITHEENQKLTQQITLAELKHAVFQMENSKSHGVDGIPTEFYKTHFELIKLDHLDLFNSILFQNEKIPTTVTRAIITLIPKNDKKEFLKNWRPISLLCVDYKILTKILSNRLKLTLDKMISKEQTCGVPNRSIFSNLFTIREMINHSNTKNLPSYIVSIDQEKAFDKVDREFLYQIMKKLGYSNAFINFVKKIYQNTESIIANNGFLSSPFPLTRGVRQGCPLSLLLYIINGEVINLNVKSNPEIVGYPTPNQKQPLTLSQYADDTNFFVMTEKSITEILIFSKKYEMATGATINLSKTKIMTLGNARIYNLDQKI